ncbi:hypothetical protein EVJ58_g6111 [Rhodofomes roseus]|uniref:non-specific serine/threonine protein kinase n=1 Tax=Rhodofomes roseus TaxID=34475 RepID=A0A4Y9Y9M5_9APHY|nr:hypothetical protein EVJ58_g6111 [Rhodofomes roseus]
MLAKYRTTQQEYAIKILDKGHLRRNGKLPTALAEKNTLVRLGAGHPGIVRLHWAFQDEWSLYFVLDLARNGELQSRISRMGSLSIECARVYAAQIVDALGYMHSKGVIHRDLKPENLLLDDAFRIKITDFGTGKILDSGGERTKTFVGTAQYVSPELLEDSETSKSSDFWALGCILYQMISGRFAFQGLSEYLTWQKIKKLEYTFPEGFDDNAKDLVQKLLVRDPAERLGAGSTGSSTDMQALRGHPFFASINWGTLWTDPVPPLESGLLKKDPPPTANGNRWDDDVGASWDALVGDSDPEDDISWASDTEGQEFFATGAKPPNGYAYYEDEGPMGELRPYAFPPAIGPITDKANSPSSNSHAAGRDEGPSVHFADIPKVGSVAAAGDSSTVLANGASSSHDVPSVVKAQPIDVPAPKGAVVDSYSTGSATSSSDGSPIEQLGVALEAAGIDRGRNRAQTPIQGNRPPAPVQSEWTSLLLPHESVLFNTTVEASAPRRRGSRLLAMAVTPRRLKTRELILTTHRLLCLKRKIGRAVQVRTELFMTPSSEKEKDGRHIISSVEPKGEREFVVMTATKSHSFLAESPSMASMWIRKIQEALETHAPAAGGARTPSTSRTRT